MTYRMIDTNVLVRPIFETKTDSGLIVKQDVVPKTLWGEVLAVADHPDCKDIKVGDRVLFHKFAGKPFIDNREMLKIIPMIDLVAKEVED